MFATRFIQAFPLLATVLLLLPMGFFLFASPPLLILKHDTPVDGRFVRGLFDVYYKLVIGLGLLGAAGCAALGHPVVALPIGATALGTLALRHHLLGAMDAARVRMADGQVPAVRDFRRLHLTGMAINALLFAGCLWGLTRLVTPGP